MCVAPHAAARSVSDDIPIALTLTTCTRVCEWMETVAGVPMGMGREWHSLSHEHMSERARTLEVTRAHAQIIWISRVILTSDSCEWCTDVSCSVSRLSGDRFAGGTMAVSTYSAANVAFGSAQIGHSFWTPSSNGSRWALLHLTPQKCIR
jgi:hypothetical protein